MFAAAPFIIVVIFRNFHLVNVEVEFVPVLPIYTIVVFVLIGVISGYDQDEV